MPLFWAAFFGGLLEFAYSLTGRVLIALGVGYASYSGISTGLTYLTSQIWSHFSGLNPVILQVMGVLRVDDSISILLSAVTTKLLFKGMASGVLTRMFIKQT